MWLASLKHSAVGLEMGLAIGGCFFLGRWLDARYDTKPTLSLVMLGLGIAAAFRALFRVARDLNREAQRDEKDES